MLITIITVTYNRCSTLPTTFESILAQHYHDYEYIVIDGGSTDGSLDLIRRYEFRFEGRMRWISEPDNGPYDAMNKGIAMANGDVIGILNSDDFFTHANVLQTIADSFTPETDAIYADAHFVHPNDLGMSVRRYSSRHFRRWMLRIGHAPAHPTFYIRKSILQRHGIYDTRYRIAADFELILRLMFICRIRTHYVPSDLVTIRTGGLSYNHRLLNTYEDVCACWRNRVFTTPMLCTLRYLTKNI